MNAKQTTYKRIALTLGTLLALSHTASMAALRGGVNGGIGFLRGPVQDLSRYSMSSKTSRRMK
jgi:hypothetical protein